MGAEWQRGGRGGLVSSEVLWEMRVAEPPFVPPGPAPSVFSMVQDLEERAAVRRRRDRHHSLLLHAEAPPTTSKPAAPNSYFIADRGQTRPGSAAHS